MITLTLHDATQAKVEDGVDFDPDAVPAPVDAGDSFVAVVRGSGMRISASAVSSMTHVYWDFALT
jgi:hypothetical protein